MKRVTVDRYWRMESLDEERGAVMDGMIRLIHAYEYLKNDGSSSEETLTAMRLIMPIIGTLEDRNKGMAEESGDLWDAILDLDGAELSSAEIERERADAALGEDWISRAMRRLEKSWPVEEILIELAQLRDELSREKWACIERQKAHQRERADALARQAGFVN